MAGSTVMAKPSPICCAMTVPAVCSAPITMRTDSPMISPTRISPKSNVIVAAPPMPRTPPSVTSGLTAG